MDRASKKTALRMIPYGLYVLTVRHENEISAGTVTWVTQTAFEPTLIVVGVKADSRSHSLIKHAGVFTLNILGKDQQDTAFAFFKPSVTTDGTLSGRAVRSGDNGCPILVDAPAYLECKLVDRIEGADHSIFVGEVTAAGLQGEITGRPEEHALTLSDLGGKIYYGG